MHSFKDWWLVIIMKRGEILKISASQVEFSLILIYFSREVMPGSQITFGSIVAEELRIRNELKTVSQFEISKNNSLERCRDIHRYLFSSSFFTLCKFHQSISPFLSVMHFLLFRVLI